LRFRTKVTPFEAIAPPIAPASAAATANTNRHVMAARITSFQRSAADNTLGGGCHLVGECSCLSHHTFLFNPFRSDVNHLPAGSYFNIPLHLLKLRSSWAERQPDLRLPTPCHCDVATHPLYHLVTVQARSGSQVDVQTNAHSRSVSIEAQLVPCHRSAEVQSSACCEG